MKARGVCVWCDVCACVLALCVCMRKGWMTTRQRQITCTQASVRVSLSVCVYVCARVSECVCVCVSVCSL
jgi:hypothetical protein